ncbi:variable surface lipoprotein, partial [Mycoplasmopsis bovis]|uniref:variable surface lipoprotein n=1 Tax=Mycoplasmopsis bovis TaxID=28903 RepID=UPI0032F069B4
MHINQIKEQQNMNKKKLILIRGGLLFASSLPLIAASCKNNETKEPKKEPEIDA